MRPNAHHTLVVLAIAFCAAAISVPGALGGVRPDDRAGAHGIGSGSASSATAAAVPDWFERAVIRHNAAQSPAVRPDDRGGIRGIGLSAAPQQSLPGNAAGGNGFRWTDAAPWAGGALLLVLLLAGAAQAARQRRRLSVTF